MQSYDVIIIGGGVAGLAAAMYSGRFNFRTLVLSDNFGGVIVTTDVVENYPGFKRLTGLELAEKLREHALDYPSVQLVDDVKATDIKKEGNVFKVVGSDGKSYIGKTLIFTTGTVYRKLNVPGENEFSNKGVHYCMLCDGALYKEKIMGVVGGGDSAGKEAILGAQWAKKIYIIYRGEKIRPEPVNMDRIEKLMKEGKIEIINNTNVVEIKGEKFLNHVIFDKPYKGSKEFKLDALFIEIGHVPLSELAVKIGVKANDRGEIIINRNAETNIPGIFAAGDVVDTRFKQAITGVGEAVAASYSAYLYIKENEKIFPTTAPEYMKSKKPVEQKEFKRIVKQIRKK